MIKKRFQISFLIVFSWLVVNLIVSFLLFSNKILPEGQQQKLSFEQMKEVLLLENQPSFKVKQAFHENNVDTAWEEIQQRMSLLHDYNHKYKLGISDNINKLLSLYENEVKIQAKFSREDELLKVLGNKLNLFNNWVEKKNWNNLTKISARMMKRIESNEKNIGRYLFADYSSMRDVTNRSRLDSKDKDLIFNKMSRFESEVTMLEKMEKSAKRLAPLFKKHQRLGRNAFISIKEKLNPKESSSFLVPKKGFLYGVLFSWLALVIFTLILSKKSFSKNSRSISNHVLDLLQGNWRNLSDYTPEDKKAVYLTWEKFQEDKYYIEQSKHLFPLAMAVIDEKKNFIWTNGLFQEQFQVEGSMHEEGISWDNLKKSFKFSEGDPIEESMRNPDVHICQFNFSPNKSVCVNYELVLSPIKESQLDTQHKLLAVFYPLIGIDFMVEEQLRIHEAKLKEALTQKSELSSSLSGFQGVLDDIKSIEDRFKLETAFLKEELDKMSKELQDKDFEVKDFKNQLDSARNHQEGLGQVIEKLSLQRQLQQKLIEEFYQHFTNRLSQIKIAQDKETFSSKPMVADAFKHLSGLADRINSCLSEYRLLNEELIKSTDEDDYRYSLAQLYNKRLEMTQKPLKRLQEGLEVFEEKLSWELNQLTPNKFDELALDLNQFKKAFLNTFTKVNPSAPKESTRLLS